MTKRIQLYWQLMRFDKPVGIFLLLWPTLWALWLATHGNPSLKMLCVFTLGVIVTRAAGCVINDIADRHFDHQVSRTRNRPLASQQLSVTGAILCFITLCFLALLLVLQLNWLTIKISFLALGVAMIYPWMKRVTHLPQCILGVAFAFAVIMVYTAQQYAIPRQAWLIFTITVIWAILYDTEYALVDRDDDIKAGIKSTAVLFGTYAAKIIAVLQGVMLSLLVLLGQWSHLHWPYYGAIVVVAFLFGYQQHWLHSQCHSKIFRAFLNNAWVGGVLWLGIVLSL